MIFSQKPVMIREFGGEVRPFDGAELQTRLIGCFLAAGRRESVDLPQDIVLAVEATLQNSPREEAVFGRGELECAVIRLLEEIGFPEVAKLFRSGSSGESLLLVTPEEGTLTALLQGHLSASGAQFKRIIRKVMQALETLKVRRCSAHLLLELARHYEREMEQRGLRCAVERTPSVTLAAPAIAALLPPEAEKLEKEGSLRFDGITTLFPCIHLYFFMENWAKVRSFRFPVTELELEPALYPVSSALAGAAAAVEGKLERQLPVILDVPDMFDFIADCAGGERTGSSSLAAELGGVLASGFPRGVYKLNLN